jgi:hypothetical protein
VQELAVLSAQVLVQLLVINKAKLQRVLRLAEQ